MCFAPGVTYESILAAATKKLNSMADPDHSNLMSDWGLAHLREDRGDIRIFDDPRAGEPMINLRFVTKAEYDALRCEVGELRLIIDTMLSKAGLENAMKVYFTKTEPKYYPEAAPETNFSKLARGNK